MRASSWPPQASQLSLGAVGVCLHLRASANDATSGRRDVPRGAVHGILSGARASLGASIHVTLAPLSGAKRFDCLVYYQQHRGISSVSYVFSIILWDIPAGNFDFPFFSSTSWDIPSFRGGTSFGFWDWRKGLDRSPCLSTRPSASSTTFHGPLIIVYFRTNVKRFTIPVVVQFEVGRASVPAAGGDAAGAA